MSERKIKIIFEKGIEIQGILDSRLNPNTVNAVLKDLPFESTVNLWGEEIYFPIPTKVGLEKGQEYVDVGTIAYWPEGHSLCLFFGKTPVSTDDRPKAYSPVNVIGKILDEITNLKKVKDGEKVRVELA
ncbi:MAG: hypothetical protein J7L47_06550 [Candidatus Odinarchaeota archaeon]|nr:hypothetical protein [Candidatus Odinarchaeota archaeon]